MNVWWHVGFTKRSSSSLRKELRTLEEALEERQPRPLLQVTCTVTLSATGATGVLIVLVGVHVTSNLVAPVHVTSNCAQKPETQKQNF